MIIYRYIAQDVECICAPIFNGGRALNHGQSLLVPRNVEEIRGAGEFIRVDGVGLGGMEVCEDRVRDRAP